MVKKKTPSQKVSRTRQRGVPDDACPACGTTMVVKHGTLRLPVNGEEIAVPSA